MPPTLPDVGQGSGDNGKRLGIEGVSAGNEISMPSILAFERAFLVARADVVAERAF